VYDKQNGCPNLDKETDCCLDIEMPSNYSFYRDSDPEIGAIHKCRLFEPNARQKEREDIQRAFESGLEYRDFFFLDGQKALEEYRFREERGELRSYSCVSNVEGIDRPMAHIRIGWRFKDVV
jgi:hypothetical protein